MPFEKITEGHPSKGKWRAEQFKNNNPIVLELGCGKGEYAVGLGKHYADKNFIGVDLKGNRIYIGAKEVLETGMKNVVFLRSRIDYITNSFSENEVDEIWLTFSDPQPNKPRKRLTSPLFIERYRKILKPGGIIHVKTDSDVLFEYTEEQIKENNEYLVEKPSELFLNGQYSAERYLERHLIEPESVLSGAFAKSVVDAPIHAGLYGVAKAQKVFVDCLLNLLYEDMSEEDLRKEAERTELPLSATLDSAFLEAPRALKLDGLVRYRQQVINVLQAREAERQRAENARKRVEDARTAALRTAAKATYNRNEAIRANRRHAMEHPVVTPPPPVPSSSWSSTMGKMMGYVPRTVAGGTRRRRRY